MLLKVKFFKKKFRNKNLTVYTRIHRRLLVCAFFDNFPDMSPKPPDYCPLYLAMFPIMDLFRYAFYTLSSPHPKSTTHPAQSTPFHMYLKQILTETDSKNNLACYEFRALLKSISIFLQNQISGLRQVLQVS